ncbi:MAG: hypothetical protein R2883_06365 [Caldisericia bacterium]
MIEVSSETVLNYNRKTNTLVIVVSGSPESTAEIEKSVSNWIEAIEEAVSIAGTKIWLILDIRDLEIPSFRTVPKDNELKGVFSKNVFDLVGVVSSTNQRLKMKLMFLFMAKGSAVVEYVTDAEEVISKQQEKFGVFPPL